MAFLDYLHRVAGHGVLDTGQAEEAMGMILEGQASTPQIAAFLVALKMRAAGVSEMLGFTRAMRARSLPVDVSDVPQPVLDTCGTGGDSTGSFNISTVAAIVVAGAGVRVAKHGNRSMASHCGSADILEALGVKITLTPDQMAHCIRRAGIGFLFAPALHPAMKHAQPARAEIKMRTVFNLLGPLTNPAGALYQLIGAPSEQTAQLMAEVLAELGTGRALIVHGSDGMDEITTTGPTFVFEVANHHVTEHVWQPSDFGIPRASLSDFAAPAIADNLRIARAVLAGEDGPCRDIVLVNAAAALMASGAATSPSEGVQLARHSIDSGAARERLESLIHVSTTTGS